MVTSTKDTWLPCITSFSAWERSNRLGGLKVIIQQQVSTAECHIRELINMTLREYANAHVIAVS
eukprot:7926228-Ditylum_brightwellii.AAC.1